MRVEYIRKQKSMKLLFTERQFQGLGFTMHLVHKMAVLYTCYMEGHETYSAFSVTLKSNSWFHRNKERLLLHVDLNF